MVIKYRDPSFCQFIALGFKTLQIIEKQQNAALIQWVKFISEGPVRKIKVRVCTNLLI